MVTMPRFPVRLAFCLALALLGLAGATLARASIAALDDLEQAALSDVAEPALLGPVNELGRNGWNCLPERAAAAKRARAAELPSSDSY